MHWIALIFWLLISGIVIGAYIFEYLTEKRNRGLEKAYEYSMGQGQKEIANFVDEARKDNFKAVCSARPKEMETQNY